MDLHANRLATDGPPPDLLHCAGPDLATPEVACGEPVYAVSTLTRGKPRQALARIIPHGDILTPFHPYTSRQRYRISAGSRSGTRFLYGPEET